MTNIKHTKLHVEILDSRLLGFNKSLMFLAVRFGLIQYVKEQLNQRSSISEGKEGAALLREALC